MWMQVMAPFTPFFVESMYQNLRRCSPSAPESVHYTSIPEPAPSQVSCQLYSCVNGSQQPEVSLSASSDSSQSWLTELQSGSNDDNIIIAANV